MEVDKDIYIDPLELEGAKLLTPRGRYTATEFPSGFETNTSRHTHVCSGRPG